MPTPPVPLDDAEISFATPRVGWLVAGSFHTPTSGSTWVTRDAGRHWSRIPLRAVRAVAVTAGHAYLVAGHALVVSSVSGGRWHSVGRSVGNSLFVQGERVFNYDSDTEFAAGRALAQIVGDRVRTTRAACPRRFAFSAGLTATPSGGLLLVCGSEPGAGNQLKRAYLSPDNGADWRPVTAPDESGYIGGGAGGSAGAFIDGGRMQLQASFDGGHSWRVVVSGSGTAGGIGPIGFSRHRYGWAVDAGPPAGIYLTDDGGRTWHRATNP